MARKKAGKPKPEEQNDNVYKVEKLLGHRGQGINTEIWVQWKGYTSSSNEWVPIRNLTPDLIKQAIQAFNLKIPDAEIPTAWGANIGEFGPQDESEETDDEDTSDRIFTAPVAVKQASMSASSLRRSSRKTRNQLVSSSTKPHPALLSVFPEMDKKKLKVLDETPKPPKRNKRATSAKNTKTKKKQKGKQAQVVESDMEPSQVNNCNEDDREVVSISGGSEDVPLVQLSVLQADDGEYVLEPNVQDDKEEELTGQLFYLEKIVPITLPFLTSQEEADFKRDLENAGEDVGASDSATDIDEDFEMKKGKSKKGKDKKDSKKEILAESSESPQDVEVKDTSDVSDRSFEPKTVPPQTRRTSRGLFDELELLDAELAKQPVKKKVLKHKRAKFMDESDEEQNVEEPQKELPRKDIPVAIEQATASSLILEPIKKDSIIEKKEFDSQGNVKKKILCRLTQSSVEVSKKDANVHSSSFQELQSRIREGRMRSIQSSEDIKEPEKDEAKSHWDGQNESKPIVDKKTSAPTSTFIPKRTPNRFQTSRNGISNDKRKPASIPARPIPTFSKSLPKIPKKTNQSLFLPPSGDDDQWGSPATQSQVASSTIPQPPSNDPYSHLLNRRKPQANIRDSFSSTNRTPRPRQFTETGQGNHPWDDSKASTSTRPSTPPADGWGDSGGNSQDDDWNTTSTPVSKPQVEDDGWDTPSTNVPVPKPPSIEEDDGWNSAPSVVNKALSTIQNDERTFTASLRNPSTPSQASSGPDVADDDGWGESSMPNAPNTRDIPKRVHFADVPYEDTVSAPKRYDIPDEDDDDDIVW